MHASNTAAWRAKVREASDGIEAVKKELGTGRLHPETIIFAIFADHETGRYVGKIRAEALFDFMAAFSRAL